MNLVIGVDGHEQWCGGGGKAIGSIAPAVAEVEQDRHVTCLA